MSKKASSEKEEYNGNEGTECIHTNPYDVSYDNQNEKIGIIETLKNIFFIVQMMVVLIFISHKLNDRN